MTGLLEEDGLNRESLSIKAAIATLGCKVNQYESEGLGEALTRRGYTMVPFSSVADCYIINTCTVTARTNYQSRQIIRKAIRNNPEAVIVVTGCYAQTAPAEIAGIPGVTLIAGHAEKDQIPDLIARLLKERLEIRVGDIGQTRQFSSLAATRFKDHTRAFLKIQDGCNAWCSYCIIPSARGRSRSLAEGSVLEQLAHMGRTGYREVVLTGIHLGAYGQDFSPQSSLVDLLRKVEEQHPVERLRLSSIEPTEISDDFIALLRQSALLCPHLHIPLQSGDDSILTRMKRHYTTSFFKDLLEKLCRAIPDLAIGIDVIAGFPGEGEAAFERTVELIESLPVAYLHVFPYSVRPGTPAAAMPDQVSPDEKKKRAEILRTLGTRKREAFARRFHGRSLRVLVEERRERSSGLRKGFSGNYLPILMTNADASQVNQLVQVQIENIDGTRISGRIMTP
ncbi:tRNA 2-methylthioadenosine synthase -like protein [Syntrophus aciditrophicus SB]|uniref:Threonylcarbamoyladenosine tRNA methylthiotransferase MtaB n=1 Tax=Syntrophus aciditrophicus (strain SB) TaxID=56780 RepID=Q2LVR5_SYNAS|nr:tRNA 2-methylthioadenosine synthase -like protein [Syntrophus aciditrophicus SB]